MLEIHHVLVKFAIYRRYLRSLLTDKPSDFPSMLIETGAFGCCFAMNSLIEGVQVSNVFPSLISK